MTFKPLVFLRVLLLCLGLGILPGSRSVIAKVPFEQSLVNRIQKSLNNPLIDATGELKYLGSRKDFILLHRRLKSRFSDLEWKVTHMTPLKDNQLPVVIYLTGNSKSGPQEYSLESTQKLILGLQGDKIIEQRLVSEQSILTNNKKDLPISIRIPDTVLTGTRYDLDIVLEEPLGEDLLAGGLIALDDQDIYKDNAPDIEISPMPGGGLFKTVQASYSPGIQTWGIFLVHPDGLISITKSVRIVSDEEELRL